jgi:hypothetical protein
VPALIVLLIAGVASINFCLNTGFYRPLLQYQTGIAANNIINGKHIDKPHFFVYKIDAGRSLDFYGNYPFKRIDSTGSLTSGDYLLTSAAGLDSLNKNLYKIIDSGQSFHVTTLTLQFLNPAKRNTQTNPFYVLRRL